MANAQVLQSTFGTNDVGQAQQKMQGVDWAQLIRKTPEVAAAIWQIVQIVMSTMQSGVRGVRGFGAEPVSAADCPMDTAACTLAAAQHQLEALVLTLKAHQCCGPQPIYTAQPRLTPGPV